MSEVRDNRDMRLNLGLAMKNSIFLDIPAHFYENRQKLILFIYLLRLYSTSAEGL